MHPIMSFVEKWQTHGNSPFSHFGTPLAEQETTSSFVQREDTMYNRKFFKTQLGQAALASIAAMTAFVALSSQIAVTTPVPVLASINQVELA